MANNGFKQTTNITVMIMLTIANSLQCVPTHVDLNPISDLPSSHRRPPLNSTYFNSTKLYSTLRSGTAVSYADLGRTVIS